MPYNLVQIKGCSFQSILFTNFNMIVMKTHMHVFVHDYGLSACFFPQGTFSFIDEVVLYFMEQTQQFDSFLNIVSRGLTDVITPLIRFTRLCSRGGMFAIKQII